MEAAIKNPDYEEKLRQVKEMLEKHKGEKGALLQVLQEVQLIMGYVPLEVQELVAEACDVTLSEVYSTLTFYSFFNLQPRGKYLIRVCLGTACYVRGAEKILDRIQQDLKIEVGGTTEDGLFTLEACRCVGACGLAPCIIINDDVHGRLTADKIPAILAKYE